MSLTLPPRDCTSSIMAASECWVRRTQPAPRMSPVPPVCLSASCASAWASAPLPSLSVLHWVSPPWTAPGTRALPSASEGPARRSSQFHTSAGSAAKRSNISRSPWQWSTVRRECSRTASRMRRSEGSAKRAEPSFRGKRVARGLDGVEDAFGALPEARLHEGEDRLGDGDERVLDEARVLLEVV